MKAFIHGIDEQTGRDILGTGFPRGGTVTNAYKNFQSFKRHVLDKLPKGRFHVELFNDWGNRYGKPDRDFIITV